MKNPINAIFLTKAFRAVFPLSQGGTKNTDRLLISLKTKTTRISNTWCIENYKVNRTDYTSLVRNYAETFTKDGVYSYKMGILNGTGTWTFENNNQTIRITGMDNPSTVDLVIIKLDELHFWYYYMDGEDKKEFHLIKE